MATESPYHFDDPCTRRIRTQIHNKIPTTRHRVGLGRLLVGTWIVLALACVHHVVFRLPVGTWTEEQVYQRVRPEFVKDFNAWRTLALTSIDGPWKSTCTKPGQIDALLLFHNVTWTDLAETVMVKSYGHLLETLTATEASSLIHENIWAQRPNVTHYVYWPTDARPGQTFFVVDAFLSPHIHHEGSNKLFTPTLFCGLFCMWLPAQYLSELFY